MTRDSRIPKYGLVGDGRLARHLDHYLGLLQLPYRKWSRREANATGKTHTEALKDCSVILLAVSDRAIEQVAREVNPDPTPPEESNDPPTLIHFSGTLQTPLAWGFHPLMTFGHELYSREIYERIPFIFEEGAPDFTEVFPQLPNPSARISADKRALYHAWCVMGGNFTAFLWGRMFESFSRDLGLAPELAAPYLKQVSENLLAHTNDPRKTWTGPLVRGDQATIDSHLAALSADIYQPVYRAFVEAIGNPGEKPS